jgi:hypothetical protein
MTNDHGRLPDDTRNDDRLPFDLPGDAGEIPPKTWPPKNEADQGEAEAPAPARFDSTAE